MKFKKNILGGSLCAVIALLTPIFLNSIDGTKFSTQISVTILLLIGVVFSIVMINNKEILFKLKFKIISFILMIIFCIIMSVDIIMNDTFPNIIKTKPLLSITIDLLAVVSLLVFVIFLVVAASITAKKNQ